MKKIKRILAAIIASAVLLSVGACSKDSKPAVITDASGNIIPPESTIDLSGYSFDTVYGSQLIGYLNRQYYFQGEAIPVAESNFYLIDAFIELSRYATYGYYPMTAEGYFDLSAPYSADGNSEFATCGDFFLNYAEKMLESTYVINSIARSEGVALTEDTMREIDATIASIEQSSAVPAGLTLDEYLQIYYGPSCTADAFHKIIENYKLADLYTEHYIDIYEFDDVPSIRYVLISAPETAGDEAIAAAEETANDILADSPDLGQLEIQGALAYTNGVAMESDVIGVVPGKCVSAFEEWAYDESREEGDIEVIYAPEYGYFVVGYEGMVEMPEQYKEDIVVKALGDMVTAEIDSGNYEFYTNDAYTPAQPVVVETDPVTGQIITPTGAASGMSPESVSTLIRVLCTVLGIGVVGGIAYFVFGRKKSDDESEDEEKTSEPNPELDKKVADAFSDEEEIDLSSVEVEDEE